MTDQQHPITPPPELVAQWFLGARAMPVDQWVIDVATQAARWGADQELEACCELIGSAYVRDKVRSARRPKPPSLKEQALMALEDGDIGPGASLTPVEVCIIRRALEQLND